MSALRRPAAAPCPRRRRAACRRCADGARAAAPQASGIGLGTCVLVSPSGFRARSCMTEEGVVIEVVPPGALARSARVAPGCCPSPVARYVVQCRGARLLRRAAEMVVTCL